MTQYADRAKETSTTTGTGTLDLDGAKATFRGLVAAFSDGAKVKYVIRHQSADEFEVGEGTVVSGNPDQLQRDTVETSSNGENLVNFSSGTKDVAAGITEASLIAADREQTFTALQGFDADVEFEGLGFRQRVEMLAAHLMEDLELEVDEISHGQAASRILGLNSLSSDPADPDAGEGLLWVSDGTGTGTDGDLVYKVTNSAGTTKTFVIGDFSAN